MLTIRRGKPQDHGAIHSVNALAFGRDGEARLVELLRTSDAFIPELSLVAEQEGQIVGHILFTRIRIVGGNGSAPALALAPMSVRPELQRRGIGTALVETGLVKCAELGHSIVVVLGHPEFFPRFGFRPAAEINIRAPFSVPDEAFMVCVLGRRTPEKTSGVVEYPPEFAAV